MLKALKSLARNCIEFFKSIPAFFISIFDLLHGLYETIINLVGFLFNILSSIDEAIEFLTNGLVTVTGVLSYMPAELVILCTLVISVVVLKFMMSLMF
ncbi:MAG: hypothetical protein E7616_04435 [Ruminococcaceae bacterium]|nr:hypothetical protein [Oscillospiraceae bacterium]